jgi:hypothetical protein
MFFGRERRPPFKQWVSSSDFSGAIMDSVAVLGYSKPLPSGARKDLARVAKRLARSGAFLAVRYDEASGQLAFLSVPERIVVDTERGESPEGCAPRTRQARPGRRQQVYMRKAGHRLWRGSIRVSKGGWWSGRIEVSSDDDSAALLTLERKGKGATLLPKDAALVIPEGEADALLDLLKGFFARARRGA